MTFMMAENSGNNPTVMNSLAKYKTMCTPQLEFSSHFEVQYENSDVKDMSSPRIFFFLTTGHRVQNAKRFNRKQQSSLEFHWVRETKTV